MPEYSGLKIDPLGDILVCPRIKTHGQCERHSPRPGKQTITPRVALSGRSIILICLYEICIEKNKTTKRIKRILALLNTAIIVLQYGFIMILFLYKSLVTNSLSIF